MEWESGTFENGKSSVRQVSPDPVQVWCFQGRHRCPMRKHRLPNLRLKIDAILDAELSVGRQLGLVGTPVSSCTVPNSLCN